MTDSILYSVINIPGFFLYNANANTNTSTKLYNNI